MWLNNNAVHIGFFNIGFFQHSNTNNKLYSLGYALMKLNVGKKLLKKEYLKTQRSKLVNQVIMSSSSLPKS